MTFYTSLSGLQAAQTDMSDDQPQSGERRDHGLQEEPHRIRRHRRDQPRRQPAHRRRIGRRGEGEQAAVRGRQHHDDLVVARSRHLGRRLLRGEDQRRVGGNRLYPQRQLPGRHQPLCHRCAGVLPAGLSGRQRRQRDRDGIGRPHQPAASREQRRAGADQHGGAEDEPVVRRDTDHRDVRPHQHRVVQQFHRDDDLRSRRQRPDDDQLLRPRRGFRGRVEQLVGLQLCRRSAVDAGRQHGADQAELQRLGRPHDADEPDDVRRVPADRQPDDADGVVRRYRFDAAQFRVRRRVPQSGRQGGGAAFGRDHRQ